MQERKPGSCLQHLWNLFPCGSGFYVLPACCFYLACCSSWATQAADGRGPGSINGSIPHPAAPANNALSIREKSIDQDTVAFLLSTKETLEATLTFSCYYLNNARSSHALPYTFVVEQPQTDHEILRFVRIDRTKPARNVQWRYSYKFGKASKQKSKDYSYALPYSRRASYKVIQAFRGNYSHRKGYPYEYAIDFAMPPGTCIRASRPGEVIALRADSNAGGDSPRFEGRENYVVIKHGDGTYAVYAHLKQNGVLVKLGQSVKEGEKIALSGATGWADIPHLHFSVYRVLDGHFIKSIPFRLKKNGLVLPELKEGQRY